MNNSFLRKLADQVIGSIKSGSGGWDSVDVDRWIRNTRQEEDKHWLNRLDEAVKPSLTQQIS